MNLVLLQTVGGVSPLGVGGGGIQQFVGVAESWQRSGHEVVMIRNASDRDSAVYSGLNRVIELPTVDTLRFGNMGFVVESLLNALVQSRQLHSMPTRLSLTSGSTVVISTSPSLSDLAAGIFLSRRLRARHVVAFFHSVPGPLWFFRRRGGLARTLPTWLLNRIALGVAYSTGASCLFLAGTHSGEPGRERGDSIVVDCYDNVPPGMVSGPNDRPIDASYVGRLTEGKGVFDLLDVWKLVHRELPQSRLALVGDFRRGSTLTQFRTKAAEMGLTGCIELLGEVSDATKFRLLSQSKIFLFPSYEEGWSLSVMEATRLGAIPVTYDLPAYGFLGASRITAPVGNVPLLAEKVIRTLRGDDGDRAKLSDELRAQLTRYTRDIVASEYLSHFEGAAASRPAV
jgi:glycosyltransferase involved in cell wall biosynthesis